MADRRHCSCKRRRLRRAPDLIYLPELPFDIETFGAKVKDLLARRNPLLLLPFPRESGLQDGRYVCELGHVASTS